MIDMIEAFPSLVRRIVDRVDQAFKTRKEECRRLLWEISDLENQLECLQKNTRDYSEASAAQGAALSWSQANIEKIQDRWKGIEESSLKPMLREYHLLVKLTDDSKNSLLIILFHLLYMRSMK